MLAFACPACRKRADWPDDWRGERVDCPFCGKCMELTERRQYRDEDEGDEPRELRPRRERFTIEDRPSRRRRLVTCPNCDCRDEPMQSREMAQSAWVFIVIGLFFWPLIILAVLMKDTWEVCPECRHRFRKVGGTTFG